MSDAIRCDVRVTGRPSPCSFLRTFTTAPLVGDFIDAATGGPLSHVVRRMWTEDGLLVLVCEVEQATPESA